MLKNLNDRFQFFREKKSSSNCIAEIILKSKPIVQLTYCYNNNDINNVLFILFFI